MSTFDLYIFRSFVSLSIEYSVMRIYGSESLINLIQSLFLVLLEGIKFLTVLQDFTCFRAPEPERILIVHQVNFLIEERLLTRLSSLGLFLFHRRRFPANRDSLSFIIFIHFLKLDLRLFMNRK
jgi:hypothetical protein